MLTIDNVYRASNALKGVIRKTDVIYAPKLCKGVDLYLKTENLQVTGSFKVRGAYYKMTKLSEEEKQLLINEIPADRMGKVSEAADMVYSILQMPSYTTGQVFTMDGGWQ